jgi:hypothetical protein
VVHSLLRRRLTLAVLSLAPLDVDSHALGVWRCET